jgi:hypothetical protein
LQCEGLILPKTILRRLSVLVVLIAAILVSSISPYISSVAGQTALLSSRTLGDKWTLSVNYQQPYGLKGIMTEEITNTSFSVSGYDCTEFTMTGGGTTSGSGYTGNWTISGKQYETKTDYTTPKTENTINTTTTTFNETITTETICNPPLNDIAFPLYVGKTWSSTTTQAITFKHYLNGVLTNSTSNQKITQNCSVLRTEDIQVPAGSFQTFVIRRTDSGGSSSDIYYSEKAHRQVKELDYMPGGSLAFSLELLDYSVAEPTTSPVPTPTPTQTPQSIPTQQPTATETPSPSIPELSWLTVLPLLLFSLLTIIVIKKKK